MDEENIVVNTEILFGLANSQVRCNEKGAQKKLENFHGILLIIFKK